MALQPRLCQRLLALLLVAMFAASCGGRSGPGERRSKQSKPAAFFEFRGSDDRDRFVIKLVELHKIEHARSILSGDERTRVHVSGTIVKSPAPYNPRWSYHLQPESIEFFELAIEVCDANMRHIEERLEEVGGEFLPKSHWCPWASKLSREIVPPSGD